MKKFAFKQRHKINQTRKKRLHFSYRSSPLEVFCKKVALKNFAKFTEKHLCQTLFLIKLQAVLECKKCWKVVGVPKGRQLY